MKISNYLVSLRPLWGRDSFLLCTSEVPSQQGLCHHTIARQRNSSDGPYIVANICVE